MKRITPGQALRIGSETATAVHGSDLPQELIQALIDDRARMDFLGREQVKLIGAVARGELSDGPIKIISANSGRNKKATRDYPPKFKMSGWEDQVKSLLATGTFSDLSTDGLLEIAEGYLKLEQIWQETFVFSLDGQPARLWDELIVFALPGKCWARWHDRGNIWDDVAKGRNGDGYWGALCEGMLFPELQRIKQFKNFVNYRKDTMKSDRFLPLDSVAVWLQELESQIPGDFACRPFNFGRRMTGHNVISSRWAAEYEIASIVTPTWVNGQGLITHPDRLTVVGSFIDNGGDQYRFGVDREFMSAPYFYHDDGKPYFDTYHVSNACSYYGAPVCLR